MWPLLCLTTSCQRTLAFVTTFHHNSSESTRHNFIMWALSCTTFSGLQMVWHFMCHPVCSTFLHILPIGRHPEYSASLTDVIPFLDSAKQSNTILCLIASSFKANANTWNVSAPIFPIWNNNLMHMHRSLKSIIFWSNKTALDTTHSHPAQQRMPQLWNQQQTTQVLLYRHLDDEFCTNCGSCGRHGVAGGRLTL